MRFDVADNSLWRDELMSKAAALVPDEVLAARSLLEKMRFRPRSAKRPEPRAEPLEAPVALFEGLKSCFSRWKSS